MKKKNSRSLSVLFISGALIWSFQSCNIKTSDSHNHDTDSTHTEHGHQTKEKDQAHSTHWSYAGETGPEKWASLCSSFSDCSGKHQSPIDITGGEFSAELSELELNYTDGQTLNAINNGHTVQINQIENSFLSLDSVKYELKQLHFHCPSEHTVGSEAFPMEVHLVHISDDKNIAVVGVLFVEGEENSFLTNIINELPSIPDSSISSETQINITSLLPVTKKYYKYMGSLTTPPCSEGVNWFVLQTPITASKEQIEKIASIMPVNNARPVQPLNDRPIKTN